MNQSLLTNKKQIKSFQNNLLKWYQHNKREMPWRENQNPYYIWVSEIMLQQTRVETVIPFFNRFISTLPTISDLAAVDDEKLLKLWEGLGYYSRVKNMKQAALYVMEHNQGRLYDTKKELETLKGIGPYSAGAIASIAFNEKVSAVDGNVLRIFARLLNSNENILSASTKKKFTLVVEKVLPDQLIGDFNQALMELGALICIPNNPSCEKCPVIDFCMARKNKVEKNLPIRIKKLVRKKEKLTVLILQYEDEYALNKRDQNQLLGGLYEFPNITGHLTKNEIIKQVDEWGADVVEISNLENTKALFTHIEWNMKGYHILVNRKTTCFTYVKKDVIKDHLPVASAFKSFIKII